MTANKPEVGKVYIGRTGLPRKVTRCEGRYSVVFYRALNQDGSLARSGSMEWASWARWVLREQSPEDKT